MPTARLEKVLEERLDELGRSGRLKGKEMVIAGVVPPRNGNGPRYLLDGEGDRPFLRGLPVTLLRLLEPQAG